MADANSTDTLDLIETAEHITLSTRRRLVALEATWEIAALCGVIPLVAEDAEFGKAVRGISKRIKDLNSAIMSALSDDGFTTDDLCCEVLLTAEGGAA